MGDSQQKMKKPLEYLTKEELIQRVEDLQEELRMSQAFVEVLDTGSTDATLQWRGRNRFLSEKPIAVKLEPDEVESFNPSMGEHQIIDGDNLSVMTSLLTDYRGGPNKGIDIIYFDGPYNTGEDIFSFLDDYLLSKNEVKKLRRKVGRSESLVSLDDPSRHTKWINHMAPRLWAARKLLKSTGVIIISIDEHELPRLWMLMEEIFLEHNRIATLIWERSRKNDANYISEGHEYLLVWAKNKEELDAKRGQMALDKEWEKVKGRWRKRKEGVDAILTAYMEAKVQFGDDIESIQKALDEFFKALPKSHPVKKIRYKKVDHRGVYNDDGNPNWPGGNGPRYDVLHPKTGKPCKVPASGWRYSEEEMNRLIAEGRVAFKANHNYTPRIITYLHEMESEVQTSVISKVGQRAVEVVEAILGKGVFKNPKDHEILAELFNLVTWRDKNAVILDAYGGSGTSGHAVIEMNAEDLGNRRFIIIEQGDPKAKNVSRERYTAEITAERIRRVISGKWADGKEHPSHKTGFHFYRAHKEISKRAIMASTRESLADIILQVVEEDSNRIDFRFEGHTYLIGRTRLGYGIALVWENNKGSKNGQTLTWSILEKILDEAEQAKVTEPIHIYASANIAPINDDLYRFHQIPDSILARLGIFDDEEAEV